MVPARTLFSLAITLRRIGAFAPAVSSRSLSGRTAATQFIATVSRVESNCQRTCPIGKSGGGRGACQEACKLGFTPRQAGRPFLQPGVDCHRYEVLDLWVSRKTNTLG